jgi:hypothetical protein
MPADKVIQLRQLLSDKFGARMRFGTSSSAPANSWPTGLSQLDKLLGGGLRKSELTEIIATKKSSGSASVICALLDRAAQQGQIIALIDGSDMLDVTHISESSLARLLWVRCRSADEAMKAADLILRDSNLSLVILDLVGSPAHELRKIPPPAWYRFQRLLEASAAVCVVLTPWAMVSPATSRITLDLNFSLAVLESNTVQVLEEIKANVSEERQGRENSQQSFA